MRRKIISIFMMLALMFGVFLLPVNSVSASNTNTTTKSTTLSVSNFSNFFWIWQLQGMVDRYGSIEALISHLKSIGITNVCVKYHEGSSYYGSGVNFKSDYLKYYNAFKSAGFTVGTWGYNYFNYPGTEANIIVEALQNSDYYIYDPEVDVSNKWTASADVCATVRRSTNKLIGYSSFPIATYHQDIPYSVFESYCDFSSPQIYWGELQWDISKAVNQTISSYKTLGLNLPMFPSIQTYGVTVASYSTFNSYGFKYCGLWDLDECDSNFYSSLNISASNSVTDSTAKVDALKQSNAFLQNDCNIVHGSSLVVDGIIGTKSLNTLNSYPIELNTNNIENQWIQQKLISYNYLPKGNDTGYWTQACKDAVQKMQHNWGRTEDGIVGIDTWKILTTN